MAAEQTVVVPISHSTYWIAGTVEGYELSEDRPEIAPGLLEADGVSGSVVVAAEWEVPLRVQLLQSRPAEQADSWEDVVEFSLTTQDDLRIWPLFDEPLDPDLAHAGPGTYRLRLHARGRDKTEEAYSLEGIPDPEADELSAEEHLLQVWPAPPAEPKVIRLTSAFARQWGADRPTREVDYSQLAQQTGTRLIVGWQDLRPPPGSATTTVDLTAMLPVSPRKAYGMFDGGNPGGIGSTVRGDPHRPNWVSASIDPMNEAIGGLTIEGDHLDGEPNSRLRFTFGFEDFRGYSYDAVPQRLVGPPHPIPPGSTTVDMTFKKHPDGCAVHVRHSDVPDWLADDVRALWLLIFEHNSHQTWSPWPWSEEL